MKKSIVSLVVILVAGIVFGQGSLTPSNAPSATMKTLQQVEPRIDIATLAGDGLYMHIITSPGSYYLSENINVTKTSGIRVNTTNTTIDLNGFAILGNGGAYGIYVTPSASGLTVRNGAVKGSTTGIYYDTTGKQAAGGLLEKVAVSECSTWGIYAGFSSRVIDCRSFNNASGLYANKGSIVSGCTAYNNDGGYGIYAGTGSKVSYCTAYSNSVSTSVIYGGLGSDISDCVVYDNQGLYAISVAYGTTVSDCVVYDNQATIAIAVGNGSKISECTVYQNKVQRGIETQYNVAIDKCTVTYNEGGDSDSYGIYARPGSSIIECVVGNQVHTNTAPTSLHGVGIYASATTIKDCTVEYNRGDGIIAVTECNISGNNCRSNGRDGDGAGIHVTGSGNRIDSNHITSNDRGLDVDVTDNLLLRNSAHGNTIEYDVVLGTVAGLSTNPITAGPWDNFEF